MTLATSVLEDATPTRGTLATTLDPARPLAVGRALRRAGVVVGDLVAAVAIALSVPFVILAIGIPIALCVRVLLWVGALL